MATMTSMPVLAPSLPAADDQLHVDVEECWTELPISHGEKLCDLPDYVALTQAGWELVSAYIGGLQQGRRYVRLYLTRTCSRQQEASYAG